MICPKCRAQIGEKQLKCNVCHFKIATLCKSCQAYNSIYNKNCVDCGIELIKTCPHCAAANFPEAKECRKCKLSFTSIEPEIVEDFEEVAAHNPQEPKSSEAPVAEEISTEDLVPPMVPIALPKYSQKKAKDKLIESFFAPDKKIIALIGDKGSGKSTVLRQTLIEIQDTELVFFVGKCDALTQLSPCGFVQNLLLNFFNLANYCSEIDRLKKESEKFFKSEFPNLSTEDVGNLFNFLYPIKHAFFENILDNKSKTFDFLNKIFEQILKSDAHIVLVAEDFDLMDGMSFEFLSQLIEKDFSKNLKLLLTYAEPRSVLAYFINSNIQEAQVEDISLELLPYEKKEKFIRQYPIYEELDQKIKQSLSNLNGNPAIIEQVMSYLSETKGEIDFATTNTFETIVANRLEILKKENNLAYLVLLAGSVHGMKFYPEILSQVFSLEDGQLSEAIGLLTQRGFIIQLNEFTFEFKNSNLWTSILEKARQDELFSNINKKMYQVYSNRTLSSNAILAIIAQDLDEKMSTFEIWTQNVKLSAYIGDVNFYIISQKQCLKLVDELSNFDNTLIKVNIFERLSKLLSKNNPEQAITYLPSVIDSARKLDQPFKEIDLLGYLTKCSMDLGNFHGVIECVDEVDNKLDSAFELEKALVKTRKLEALLKIGNVGEVINIIDSEVLPILEKYLSTKAPFPIEVIYETWLKTLLTLADALALQGNNRALQVITRLFNIFEKNGFTDKLFINQTKLTLAFAYSSKGDITSSEAILTEILDELSHIQVNNSCVIKWNLINIFNLFLQKKYTGLKEELYQIVTFANNINDGFSKHLLKTLLAKLLKDENDLKQAEAIYDEEITYFAKEKNAIGALLTWYLIAELSLVTKGPQKALELAHKALEVAQNPKINNYYFIALFNKIIAECQLVLLDYEAVKIHLEKAIMISKKFQLFDMLSKLYLLYGKYLQDMAVNPSEKQIDYLFGVSKMYKKSKVIADTIKNQALIDEIEKGKTILQSFCKLNGITLTE